jgi:4-amino-4-deoxy-L-arabinose transferase-like glycosyltransferase
MKKSESANHDLFFVGQLAAAASLAAFFYYLRQGDLLLYGDAVAHINIARRVFDSQTPGPLQLGTVWLPLPHILMLPFLISRGLWQTGIGGPIPSLAAYVFSVTGIFRLVRTVLPRGDSERWIGRLTAWLAAGVLALNPNLIYLQTTAMTEPLYLAFFIWTAVFFCEAIRRCVAGESAEANSSLVWCGICLLGACLTRYDGWLLASVVVGALILLAWVGSFTALRPGVRKSILLAAVGPALWLAYNATVYGNPLEFANGPYSAKAIEQKTSVPGMPPHPGADDLPAAFKYFFKSSQLNMAEGKLQIFWVVALIFGTATVLLFQRKLWPLLLLWIPVPFYMLSIAYSGVPLFVPMWWPFSHYNVRYGVELLPAFAVFAAAGIYGLLRFAATARTRAIIVSLFLCSVIASYIQVWRTTPASLQEGVVNSKSRIAVETQLASELLKLPSSSTYLMYLGDHVGAFQRGGIPLANVINEGNHRPWKRPTDPDGLWERALEHPAHFADYVIAFHSDAVDTSVQKSEIAPLTILRVTGQPEATIYKTLKSNQPR